jgi:hypothetical protein
MEMLATDSTQRTIARFLRSGKGRKAQRHAITVLPLCDE